MDLMYVKKTIYFIAFFISWNVPDHLIQHLQVASYVHVIFYAHKTMLMEAERLTYYEKKMYRDVLKDPNRSSDVISNKYMYIKIIIVQLLIYFRLSWVNFGKKYISLKFYLSFNNLIRNSF